MKEPEVVPCGDGYFRKVIFAMGPYIADYPEQALVTCIVQSWCPMSVKFAFTTAMILIDASTRCTADKKNLDATRSMDRTRAHTEAVVQEFELGELWQRYGIVGDIVVCVLLLQYVASLA